MKPTFLAGTTAVFLLTGSSAVLADVTPEDVWQNWQDGLATMGNQISAKTVARNGDTLVVTGITVTNTQTDGSKSLISLDEMRFTDLGDGTVGVMLPDSFPVHVVVTPSATGTDGAKPQDLTFAVTTKDARTVASGMPLSLSYQSDIASAQVSTSVTEAAGGSSVDFAATFTGISATSLNEAGESGQNKSGSFAAKALDVTTRIKDSSTKSDADVALTLSDFAGKFALTGMTAGGTDDLELAMKNGLTLDASLSYGTGNLTVSGFDAGNPMKVKNTIVGGSFNLAMAGQTFHYDIANKTISLDIAGTDKTSGQPFALGASLADFGSKLDIQGMVWGDTADFPAALKAGLQIKGGLGLGAATLDYAGTDHGKPVKVKVSLGATNSGFALDKSQTHMAAGGKALSLKVAAANMPVPEVSADLGEIAFDLAMPLSKTDSPAPFSYATRIVDLQLPQALWSMLDPATALPHDPATLIIDLKGTTTLNKDLTDDAMALENGAAEPPGLLNTLDINQIDIKALGAEVTAKGGFTFDNTDLTTFNGMPVPTGKVDIKGTGINALIDTAVKMGLLPAEQEAGTRMMLGVFANLNPGTDTLTSVLEFKDKHFFANGQKMQ